MSNKCIFIILSFLCFYTCCFSQSAVCAYKYRKRIAFNPAQVAGAADLVNFPALINITSDLDLRTVANSGHVENASGFDIIFTAADGVTKLDHQLEKYTASTGEFVGWVRIPNLSTSLTTYIYMYYGNTAIATNQSLNSTWNSGYKGVWHLNNNVFTDGTSTGNNATNGGSTNLTAAKIAGGRTFPGTNNNYIELPLSGASGGSGNGSVSLWGRITSFEASTYFFGETVAQAGYSNRIQLYIGDAAGNLYLGLGGNHSQQTNVQLLSINTWYHIALTWATTGVGVGNYSICVNGVQQGTGAYSGFTSIHTFGDLGNDGNTSQRNEEITGNVDEVHITNTALSTDWFTTEYNNQNSPSTFYTISAEPKVWTGGTNTNYNSASNWLNNSTPTSGDDVIINNGTNQPTLQGSEQVNALFIRTGAILSLAANTLSVRSDISNCGTITGNTGMVTLNSATIQGQSLSGSGTYNLNSLTINNTFATDPSVVLNTSVSVSGILALTSGIVFTSSGNILALGTGATSTSGSASSFVSGPMSKTGTADFVFSIGKGTRWRRAAVTNLSASATFTAEYFNTAYTNTSSVNAPLNNVSQLEYWQIDRSGAGNANLSLYWEAANQSGINDCPDLTIARWNGASWDERPGTATAGSNCTGAGTGILTSNAVITSFSPFTFGSKLSTVNPLPVEIIDFIAECGADHVMLSWSTASEKNHDHFVIERSSDGIDWSVITQVKGEGNSSSVKNYSFSDRPETAGIVYYRLGHADLDGRKEIFKVITADCTPKTETMRVFPNPAAHELGIELNLSQNYGKGIVKLIDDLGRECIQYKVILIKGINAYKIPLNVLPGSYSVLFYSEQLSLPAQRLIVK